MIISAVSLSKHDKTSRNVLERAKEFNSKFNIKKIQLRVPRVFQIAVRCGGWGWGNLKFYWGGIFLPGEDNLGRSDFDDSNLI